MDKGEARNSSKFPENDFISLADAMKSRETVPFIVDYNDPVLITGASGFIGRRVVQSLIRLGFRHLVCFTRNANAVAKPGDRMSPDTRIEVLQGNLLSSKDCEEACRRAAVVFHLAAGTGENSFPDAFMNSVVATRNLLEAASNMGFIRRFLLVSSFSVYTNDQDSRLLDESCPTETHPELRDAYCFAKVKQEEMVRQYHTNRGVRYVVVRPGSVYGIGKHEITGRVGLATFGLFLHLGGSNTIPFTYVDNCADAIALAGLVKGVDGEVFNIVDDDLPTSRQFLRMYKRNMGQFKSLYLPHMLSYLLCEAWEKYSQYSERQLPPAFTRKHWYSLWRKTIYTNDKAKRRLGWMPRVSTAEGLSHTFVGCRQEQDYA